MQIRKSKKQPLSLSYDNLIVGSSLEAVLFAHETQTPLINTRLERPYYFEAIDDFGLGTNKLEIWNKYSFILSLSNLMPFSNKIKHIRYVDANSITAVTIEEKSLKIKFNRLFVFDDHKFYDLPPETGVTTNENLVVDWLKVLSGKHHEHDIICRDNKFINKIIFYPGAKPRPDKQAKDCLSLSYLTDSQLYNDKYAEYVVKIKTEKLMAENNIRQNGNIKIAVEHLRRDVIKLGRNTYEDFDNVIFMYAEPKSTWEFGNKRSKINYQRYLKSKLNL